MPFRHCTVTHEPCTIATHCRRDRRCLARSPRTKPGEPEFYIQVVTDYHGNGRRLSWDLRRLDSETFPDFKVLGRFACIRVDPVHDGGALIEPTVELPLDVARELLDGLRAGAITNESVDALRSAIARSS